MRWFKILLIYTFAMIAVTAVAQKERKYLRQGNSEFEDANYQNSEVSYRKAVDLEENKTHQPAFNVGDALYKQEKYEDAIAQFESIADLDLSKEEKAMIYHNLGNSLLQSNKLKESVDAYKKALKNNPNDLDTKYNLAYAQKKLEQQKKQDQNKDKNEDQDKKDQNQDQQDQDQNKDQQDQNKDKNKQDQQDQKEQQQQQKQQISKEDAERILQAIANDEKKTQQKVKEEKAAATKVKTEKEW